MLSRSATMNLSHRAGAMRRQRRRSHAVSPLFCATNGCASFLVLDPATGLATCPICGYRRRLT
jgi:hypothetical protein